MTRTRWIFLLSVAAALALGIAAGVWWVGGPRAPEAASPPASPPSGAAGPPQTGPGRPEPPPAPPFLEIEGTNLAGTDPSGRRVWDLRAKTLEVDNARRRIALSSVRGQFYRNGSAALFFTAPAALFDVGSRDVELSGGVVARAKDGRILRASRLRWDAGRRVLEASGAVTLTQPGISVRADTLTADAALDQTRFSGNIIVQVNE